MAETYSYDNTPETEVLTSEEQDSLEVGEKLVAEQEGLLAGKYKNAEELESAYLSLQKKLGQNEEEYEEGEEGYREEEESDEEVSEYAPAISLINDASDEYYANDGALSEETISRFTEMSSQDLVNAYMEMYESGQVGQAAQAQELSDAQVNSVMNAAGGEANYNQVSAWAASNLSDRQIDAFDSVVDSGNPAAIGIAFQGLQSAYQEANGYEGRMLQGRAPSSAGEVFRSQAELVAAMGDPRYDNDPAYRADVVEKLNNSDLDF